MRSVTITPCSETVKCPHTGVQLATASGADRWHRSADTPQRRDGFVAAILAQRHVVQDIWFLGKRPLGSYTSTLFAGPVPSATTPS